jgi:hypothetical protein
MGGADAIYPDVILVLTEYRKFVEPLTGEEIHARLAGATGFTRLGRVTGSALAHVVLGA